MCCENFVLLKQHIGVFFTDSGARRYLRLQDAESVTALRILRAVYLQLRRTFQSQLEGHAEAGRDREVH